MGKRCYRPYGLSPHYLLEKKEQSSFSHNFPDYRAWQIYNKVPSSHTILHTQKWEFQDIIKHGKAWYFIGKYFPATVIKYEQGVYQIREFISLMSPRFLSFS